MKKEPRIPSTMRYPRLASAFMVSLLMVNHHFHPSYHPPPTHRASPHTFLHPPPPRPPCSLHPFTHHDMWMSPHNSTLYPLQISLVLAAVLGVVVYRLVIRGLITKTGITENHTVAGMIISAAGATTNFIFILFMSTVSRYFRNIIVFVSPLPGKARH